MRAAGEATRHGEQEGAAADAQHQLGLLQPARLHPERAERHEAVEDQDAAAGDQLHRLPDGGAEPRQGRARAGRLAGRRRRGRRLQGGAEQVGGESRRAAQTGGGREYCTGQGAGRELSGAGGCREYCTRQGAGRELSGAGAAGVLKREAAVSTARGRGQAGS